MPSSNKITIAARESPLSKKQVQEFLQQTHLTSYETHFLSTTGDRDQKTSLRTLEKTDFFTKELDQLLLEKKCDIAIHSAKDLPDPLHPQLKILALTKGVDPSDSLVLRDNTPLKKGALIGTSSAKREEATRLLHPGLRFCDIRGNIQQRLAQLDEKKVDGVVIAEAALIRLNLTHRTRIKLPSETTPFQGQLAILAHKDSTLTFNQIDTRKKLYLGLTPPPNVDHHPLIKIKPKKISLDVPENSHIIFTSKSAIPIFFENTPVKNFSYLCVGQKTAQELKKYTTKTPLIAQQETAEGILPLLNKKNYYFWPHSSLSRPLISNYLTVHSISFQEIPIYDTLPTNTPLPNLTAYKELIFTSPSTIDAFWKLHGPPPNITLTTIGPITQQHLADKLQLC